MTAVTGKHSELLDSALAHLAKAPGKRLRPRLLQASAGAIAGPAGERRAASAAEAIELIHTYSLIHDDLPAMDNDALRRGQPTLHVAFNEATAILVGDGLQARAFELIANDTALSAETRIALVSHLAGASGFDGMVGGQSLDMQATGRSVSLEELMQVHALKTGALITAALVMGGIVAGGSGQQLDALEAVGKRIGLAFQIVDDVLDVRSDSATLGKTSGKDAQSAKSTYVALLGLEGAEQEAERLYREALDLLATWGDGADGLRALLGKMVRRDH